MPYKLASAVRILIAAAAIAGPAIAQTEVPDWIDRERLATGEVLFQTVADGRGAVTIELAIRIDADWQAIWQIVTACEISPEYVPHVISCSEIDPESIGEPAIADGGSELFQQIVKPAFFLPRFEHVFRLELFPPERIEVRHVSGPLDRMEGRWQLLPTADGSMLVIQRLTVKPSFPVPRFFVRNTLERDMPPVLAEIRRRAEAAE
jgi:Polyketide cyclase / dehydrase and lipid transport